MKFTAFDNCVYYLFIILTFGMLFVYKVAMKKAISEMECCKK